jgi:hypothetical protein
VDESGFFEDAEMLRDGRARNGEAPSDLDDWAWASPEALEHGAARRIGQRGYRLSVSHNLP